MIFLGLFRLNWIVTRPTCMVFKFCAVGTFLSRVMNKSIIHKITDLICYSSTPTSQFDQSWLTQTMSIKVHPTNYGLFKVCPHPRNCHVLTAETLTWKGQNPDQWVASDKFKNYIYCEDVATQWKMSTFVSSVSFNSQDCEFHSIILQPIYCVFKLVLAFAHQFFYLVY